MMADARAKNAPPAPAFRLHTTLYGKPQHAKVLKRFRPQPSGKIATPCTRRGRPARYCRSARTPYQTTHRSESGRVIGDPALQLKASANG